MKKTILILSIITLFFAGCKKDDILEKGDMGVANGHAWVDLGLPSGTKWATCNVGATTPENYGNYYAWGETTTKSEYTEKNCPTYGLSISQLQSQGYIDGEGNLTPQYDAAKANWGGAWRMPTKTELEELINNCTWTWTAQNGVSGYKVTSDVNSNYIFLPAAGYWRGAIHLGLGRGAYWSSTPVESTTNNSCGLFFTGNTHRLNWDGRYLGQSVRPVLNENFEPEQPEDPENPEEPEQPEEPEEPETPAANQTITVNGVSFTMIAVEGGTFQMGATSEQGGDANSDESPVHSVTLSDYYIGETEVTQELWEAVMGSNPSYYSGYPQRPVEYVYWNDCQEFITKLNELTGKNFRLPTEAEWEYAARGGNKSQGYKYSGSNTIGNVAWYTDNSGDKTHDVKTKQANELGIYDMSGNVYEWCYDWYGSYSSGSQTNPTGPPTSGSGRVIRGGSWSDYAEFCRVSNRDDYSTGFTYYHLGLRLCISPENEENISGIENGYEYVDLGLPSGLKWATCNVGAYSSEDYGNYYAWGETSTKEGYYFDNCPTYGLSISELQSQGYIDSEGNLTSSHDAATANWGGSWRMPTRIEMQELIDNCTWTWITQNGVNGYKVTSKVNNNYIFLPAAGFWSWSSDDDGLYGRYWNSSSHESNSSSASRLYFDSVKNYVDWYERYHGLSVRPVFE